MKATIATAELQRALARLKPVCGGTATLPILNTVLISPEKGALVLRAFDLDTDVTVRLPANCSANEGLAVPGARLLSAVSKIAEKEVELRSEKGKFVIAAADWWLKLFALPAAEFPPFPESAAMSELTIDGTALARSLRACLRFVSDDETRYVLCGVWFTATSDELRMVSTDGRRLFSASIEVHPLPALSAIVPAEVVKLLIDLGDGQSSVRLRFGESSMEAEAGDWTLRAKLIEGEFPGIEKVIPPAGAAHQLRLPRKALLAAIPFLEAVAVKGTHTVRIQVETGGQVRVHLSTPDVGEAEALLTSGGPCDPLNVAYNAEFLRDALSGFDGDDVTLEMEDANSPCRVAEGGQLAVLMPMRIS